MSAETSPYYRVIGGRGRCAPSAKMKRNGYAGLECGLDGPEARARAIAWYEGWLNLNKELKYPSVTSADSGYIVFMRTASHLSISYVPEQSNKFAMSRLSSGKVFESLLVVRGNKQDKAYLHRKLKPFQVGDNLSLSDSVLQEMMSTIEAQKVTRPPDIDFLEERGATRGPSEAAGVS